LHNQIFHKNIIGSGSKKVVTETSSKWKVRQNFTKEISSDTFEIQIYSDCIEFNKKPPHSMFHPAKMIAELDTSGKLINIRPNGHSWFEFNNFDFSTPGFENIGFSFPKKRQNKWTRKYNSNIATPTLNVEYSTHLIEKDDMIYKIDVVVNTFENPSFEFVGSGSVIFSNKDGYVLRRDFSGISKMKTNDSITYSTYSSKIINEEK
jgi:hypothetical protein